MARWFRLYTEILEDVKVQQLPPELFRHWINLLCLASRHNGELPPSPAVTFALRISPSECHQILEDLSQAGLLEHKNNIYRPHNWKKRQYLSDSSQERTRLWRSRHRDVTAAVTVTTCDAPPDTDTDTDTESENPPTIPLLAKPVPKPKYSTEFVLFWDHSTKRGSKLAAYKAWTRIPDLADVTPLLVPAMESWMRDAEQWKDETKQPHIATWLNRRGWEEIIPKNGATRGESRYKSKAELNKEACDRVLAKLNSKNRQ